MHRPRKLSEISLVNAKLDRTKMTYSTAVTYGSVSYQVHIVDSTLESLLTCAEVASRMHTGKKNDSNILPEGNILYRL